MRTLKLLACALLFVTALAGCQFLSRPEYQAARIPPLPPELAEKHEPNLTERLLMLLSPSPPKETAPSGKAMP